MRLKVYLEKEKIRVYQFAQIIGYNKQYLGSVMSGYKKPSNRLIESVSYATNGEVKQGDWE